MEKYFGRKLYSLKESYFITYNVFRSLPMFVKGKRHEILNQVFIERIMLAVTEVNGCDICSYAHSKMALEAGMKNEEIQNMLSGIKDDVPSHEMTAIMFAQHYADFRSRPSKESWERIVKVYGLNKSEVILGAIRIIMWGNAYGIAWSSFFGRFKGKPNNRSNFTYELAMVISTIVYVPIAFVHALIAWLFQLPLLKS